MLGEAVKTVATTSWLRTHTVQRRITSESIVPDGDTAGDSTANGEDSYREYNEHTTMNNVSVAIPKTA